VNDEQERMWKEAVMAQFFRFYPGICLEGPRKATKTLSETELVSVEAFSLKYGINS
jgi:hypothetical protein